MRGIPFVRGVILCLALFYPNATADLNPLQDMLRQKLWTKRDAYNAAFYLTVPMIDAFKRDDTDLIRRYGAYFKRFGPQGIDTDVNFLTETQHNYFVSRYLALSAAKSGCKKRTKSLALHLQKRLERGLMSPAWLWSMPDFANMFERAEWKLTNKAVSPSYMRAFFDEELFSFAVAADLKIVMEICGTEPSRTTLKAVELGQRVFLNEGKYDGSKWLFQPGVWRNHPDFAYAGNPHLGPDLKKLVVEGIGWDSSHFSRVPSFVKSLMCASEIGSATRSKLNGILDGIAASFMTDVYVAPGGDFKAVRLKNYMSGDNGVYRYSYGTVGKGGGYGPYALSNSFNTGWWSVLGPSVSAAYRAQLQSQPLPENALSLYQGPVVTDKNAPLDAHPYLMNYIGSELFHIGLQAATDLSHQERSCP